MGFPYGLSLGNSLPNRKPFRPIFVYAMADWGRHDNLIFILVFMSSPPLTALFLFLFVLFQGSVMDPMGS